VTAQCVEAEEIAVILAFPCYHCGRPFGTSRGRASHEKNGHRGKVVPAAVLHERALDRGHLSAKRSRATHMEQRARAKREWYLRNRLHSLMTSAKNRRPLPSVPGGRPRLPGRNRARLAVRGAVRSGRLERDACAICEAPKVQAHHYLGYSREHQLDVVWLCQLHHSEAHHPLIREARRLAERLGTTDLRGQGERELIARMRDAEAPERIERLSVWAAGAVA